jgi:hypothetical protein
MGKRKSTVHRSAKASDFTDNLHVGDIITGEDILGIDDRAGDTLPPVGWLRGAASPFPMDVFDCRAVAMTSVSTTGDPAIVESFTRLRRSDGTEHIGTSPEDPAYVELDLRIPLHGKELREGPLFKAEQMEDKWDIFLYGNMYYFVRSWTGRLMHVAHGHIRDGVLCIDGIITASRLVDERDRTFFAREAFFLLFNHVLGFEYPHPVPSYHAGDEHSIVQFSFAEFGRRGWYAAVGVGATCTDP